MWPIRTVPAPLDLEGKILKVRAEKSRGLVLGYIGTIVADNQIGMVELAGVGVTCWMRIA